MNNYTISILADHAVTLSLGNKIDLSNTRKLVAMKQWLSEQNLVEITDIIVAYTSITAIGEALVTGGRGEHGSRINRLKRKLEEAFHQAKVTSLKSHRWEIPVCYSENFGPDLNEVAKSKNLTIEDVADIHASTVYTVYMIGFLPGFPYLGELDPRIRVQRKATPRPHVAAGSVGLAGLQTGIYPVASPGGWQIIGRTAMKLFDPTDRIPVKIQVGDSVKFNPISEKEFLQIAAE